METGVLFLPIEEELSAKGSHWREWRAHLFGENHIGNFLDVQSNRIGTASEFYRRYSSSSLLFLVCKTDKLINKVGFDIIFETDINTSIRYSV